LRESPARQVRRDQRRHAAYNQPAPRNREGSRCHPVSYPVGVGDFYQEVKLIPDSAQAAVWETGTRRLCQRKALVFSATQRLACASECRL
jgi:hypothetical protein